MNTYTATEQAYKNGYEAGVKEFAERMKSEKFIYKNFGELVQVDDINTIAEELIDKQRKEDKSNG